MSQPSTYRVVFKPKDAWKCDSTFQSRLLIVPEISNVDTTGNDGSIVVTTTMKHKQLKKYISKNMDIKGKVVSYSKVRPSNPKPKTDNNSDGSSSPSEYTNADFANPTSNYSNNQWINLNYPPQESPQYFPSQDQSQYYLQPQPINVCPPEPQYYSNYYPPLESQPQPPPSEYMTRPNYFYGSGSGSGYQLNDMQPTNNMPNYVYGSGSGSGTGYHMNDMPPNNNMNGGNYNSNMDGGNYNGNGNNGNNDGCFIM